MIQVAMATTTMSPKRIVYADGRVKRDFVGSPGSAGSPPLPVSTTCVATAGSVSLDMKLSFGGNEDRRGWRTRWQRHCRGGLRGRDVFHSESGVGVNEGDQRVEQVEE